MRCIANGAGGVLVALLFVAQAQSMGQQGNGRGYTGTASGPAIAFGLSFVAEDGMMGPDEGRGPRDPGYQSYREGYRFILEERWTEARKKLSEVLEKSPRSGYADDASFWIAYSWKYSDRAKAVAAYKKFMKEYPESNYVDDAVAELERLGEQTPQLAPHGLGMPVGSFEKITKLQQKLFEQQARMARFAAPPAMPVPMKPPADLEAKNRLKIETLQALSRMPHDEQSFRMLKDIVLDPGQDTELRRVGLEVMVSTHRGKGREVFTQVLQSKSDVRLRMTALEGLRSDSTEGDPTSYTLLKTIALNKNEPVEIRDATLQLLAEEKRPDFPEIALAMARSEQERHLRQAAIYYVAQVQEVEARRVAAETLEELLRDKTQAVEVRESALYGLQQMKMAGIEPLVLEVARHDPDERVRQAAVHALGTVPEKSPAVTSRTLEGIALDPAQPISVRQSALARLLDLHPKDAQTFFTKLASSDPDEEIQYSAIMMLGQTTRDDNMSLETLTRLYNQVPPERLRSLDVILYSIASIGSDPAVDFLVKVATESPSDELRLRAVSYLGNIGGEKARAGLYNILKRK